ncbi:MAG: cytochrome d ubiquinol oxidase subunit II, partial [Pseudomonadota bacterium]
HYRLQLKRAFRLADQPACTHEAIGKTEGALQLKAVMWARKQLWAVGGGIVAVSLATPFVSPRIFDKWFQVPEIFALAPLPLMSAALVAGLWWVLQYLPGRDDRLAWPPFWATAALFTLAFFGLAYSFYPYVVPEQLTIYDAASAPESLFIIFVGTLFVLPVIMGYTVLAYTVFRGKATELAYD